MVGTDKKHGSLVEIHLQSRVSRPVANPTCYLVLSFPPLCCVNVNQQDLDQAGVSIQLAGPCAAKNENKMEKQMGVGALGS